LQRFAWFDANATMRLQPVGKLKANAFGLFDMHGNHAEWCGIAERDSPLFTPIPGDPNNRPSRGGQFFDPAEKLRSAARDWGHHTSMGKGGFRVLKEIRD
jgi:formylglycine-generating enzyme required for sulfatase activity